MPIETDIDSADWRAFSNLLFRTYDSKITAEYFTEAYYRLSSSPRHTCFEKNLHVSWKNSRALEENSIFDSSVNISK